MPARRHATVIALAAGLLAAGCSRRDLGAVGEASTPLVLLLSPAHGGGAQPGQIAELARMLSRASGLSVAVRVAPDEEAAVSAVAANRADAAILPLFDFLFLHQEHGVHARLRVVREGGAKSYHGQIVVRAGGGVARVTDLEGKKIAFVNRYSTSGFILPAKLLADAHVHPEVTFAGSHAAALDLLRRGEVDAAASFAGAAAGDPTLAVIADTPTVANEPVLFRRGLATGSQERLASALVEVAATPGGRAILESCAAIRGFAPATDADYQEAFAVVRGAGERVEDLVPAGWKMANASRRPLYSYEP